MKLSKDIKSIFEHDGSTVVTVETILERVSSKSFGILLVILALPSALPVPAPGYSVPFGIVLILLGTQMAAARATPWFPERVLRRTIKVKEDSKALDAMVKFLAFFEVFVRPRLRFVFTTGLFYRALGCMVTLCGISMCIPVPLTNTAPAFGVFLIGLGTLEEDGLAGLAGLAASIAGIALSITVLVLIAYFGMEGVDMVKDFIKGMLGAGG